MADTMNASQFQRDAADAIIAYHSPVPLTADDIVRLAQEGTSGTMKLRLNKRTIQSHLKEKNAQFTSQQSH